MILLKTVNAEGLKKNRSFSIRCSKMKHHSNTVYKNCSNDDHYDHTF